MADDDSQDLELFRVERQDDGSILLTAGDDEYTLSEDDAMVLSRGLAAVAVNQPPALTVHLENDQRSAFLEFDV
jgi:hypothetical protein